MPTNAAAAAEAVDWLGGYAKIQRLSDRQIIGLLKDSLRQVNETINRLHLRRGVGDAVRLGQLKILKKEMLLNQASLFKKAGDVIRQRRLEAASRAVQLSGMMDQVVFASVGHGQLGTELARSMQVASQRTLDAALARMGSSSIPLSQQVYRTSVATGSVLQRRINSALARGLSAREFASEVVDWASPNTPGGARYAAMRLARTEINNAYHAMAAMSMAEKPWVVGARWNLSSSHPKADDCDKYAKDNHAGLGPGVFKKEDVPRKPHPHCLCYITGVLEDDELFLDRLGGGQYDKYLKERMVGNSDGLRLLGEVSARAIVATAEGTSRSGGNAHDGAA